AFGSPMAREVRVLREFRDRVLLPHTAGRVVVAAYYRISPPLARVVARYETVKALVRAGLRPVVAIAFRLLGPPTLAFFLVVGASWRSASSGRTATPLISGPRWARCPVSRAPSRSDPHSRAT